MGEDWITREEWGQLVETVVQESEEKQEEVKEN